MSLNRATLIGRVGSMEIKALDGASGIRKCASFSLATSEKYRNRNGDVIENTEWHNIVSWNHGEFCEKYVPKGCLLYVEGKLRTRSWEDRQGNKRNVTEILADKVVLLGKKDSNQSQAQNQVQQSTQQISAQSQHVHASGRPQPGYEQQQTMYHSQPIPEAGPPQDDDLPF